MKNLASQCKHYLLPTFCLLVSSVLATGTISAQTAAQSKGRLPVRISAEINSSERATLQGSLHPLAKPQYESGRLPAGNRLDGISLYFNRTPQQLADLAALQKGQQDPASPLYHQWLTPEQFGARFGMADSDVAKVKTWLEQQGFSVESVARAKSMIRFSGTVGQVEQAFSIELHNYTVMYQGKSEKHFAASTALSLPAALAPVVSGVRNLDDFHPKPTIHHPSSSAAAGRLRPQFTFGTAAGDNFLAPGDVTTIYDVKPLYSAGSTGTGQAIAILGQSTIVAADIEAFQTAAGLTVKAPQTVPVPNTGTYGISQGDESESDLDLEWSGAMAPGATIIFVYAGSTGSVFDSEQWAIDNNLAPIVSLSYGACEANISSTDAATLESIAQEGPTQGQTLLAASGDQGSTACFNPNNTTHTSTEETLSVSYPASSLYFTGVGGTEFDETVNGGTTATYWTNNGNNIVTTSAKSYIPEMVWNDDLIDTAQNSLAASGGGVSILFAKPSWQSNVPGIPSDGKRDVPDISLDASNEHDAYLYCTSDQSALQSGQTDSCTQGFVDSTDQFLTAAGGTSFATPIFAGMLALINEKQNYTTGQGLLNTELYKLASNATTYASAFHDITIGSNACAQVSGASDCSSSGKSGYSAGTGYDLATGLGTVDLSLLAGVWPANTGTALIPTTTAVSASNAAPAINVNDTFTITVAATTGTAIPTGTVTVTVDSLAPVTGIAVTSNGTATYTTQFTTAGTHTVTATYSGDTTFATSTGSTTVTITTTSSGSGTFKLAGTNVAVAQGSTGTSTITVTPAGGYTGTVDLTFDTSNDTALENLCYDFANQQTDGSGTVAVPSSAAVTTTLSFDTNAADCVSAAALPKTGKHFLRFAHHPTKTAMVRNNGSKTLPTGIAFAGLLLAGFLGRYAKKFRTLAGVLVLVAVGFGISACGGGSNSNTVPDPPKNTYTITLTGTDTGSATIPAATTTFTLKIQ